MLEDALGGPSHYKSRNEYRIGNLLNRYGVPFVYERPTAVNDEGKTKIWYPDFTLGYGPIIEYFGIKGNADYAKRTAHKLRVYHQNHFEVLPVYPQDFHRGWEDSLIRRVDRVLENRLHQYRNQVRQAYRCRPPVGARY